MTDIPVAPPSAAPSSDHNPAPSDHNPSEVMINQSPVDSPSPIGSQAPPAPAGEIEGSKHRTESRREALQRAFDRANNPPPKPAKPAERPALKAAEAKPGHNKPPEETPKLDLRRRPDDQQPRGERGQFAPRVKDEARPDAANSGQPAQLDAQEAQNAQLTEGDYKRLPPHVPFAEPPPRISESARRDWADTPETVRGDIHRMHQEFGKAYQHYRGAAEAFQPIAHFHQMAIEHGTTLEKALGNYTSIENRLRQDPIAGLDTIVRNLGLVDPETQQPIEFRDIAYHVLSQSPEQLRQIQQSNVQQAAGYQIKALQQEIAGLKSTLQQMHTQQQFTQLRTAVDQFAETHPRLDEVGDVVRGELDLGFDLETAYRRADLLRPATHAAQTRNTSAQTRPPDRSIHGAPDVAPSNGASRRPKEASRSPRDAVQNAIRRMNGAV